MVNFAAKDFVKLFIKYNASIPSSEVVKGIAEFLKEASRHI